MDNLSGVRPEAGKLLVIGALGSRVQALGPSTIMVLGGEPVGERFIYWNVVSS